MSSPGTQVDNLLIYIFSGLQGVILAYILNRGFSIRDILLILVIFYNNPRPFAVL
jgi:hypothetical protein